MVDAQQQLAAVRRTVGTRELDSGPARVAVLAERLDAPLDEVWDAVTSADRIPRWFLPISGDLRLGGRYQLEGHAGGTVQRCDPPHSFAATWEFGGEVSWIDVRLRAAGGGTELELEHVAHVSAQRWAQYGPGAVGLGWDSMLLGLASHLAAGGGITPEEGPEWLASAEGLRFLRAGSEAWYEASVAAGTPEPEARAAADRTLAAYTGQE